MLKFILSKSDFLLLIRYNPKKEINYNEQQFRYESYLAANIDEMVKARQSTMTIQIQKLELLNPQFATRQSGGSVSYLSSVPADWLAKNIALL